MVTYPILLLIVYYKWTVVRLYLNLNLNTYSMFLYYSRARFSACTTYLPFFTYILFIIYIYIVYALQSATFLHICITIIEIVIIEYHR